MASYITLGSLQDAIHGEWDTPSRQTETEGILENGSRKPPEEESTLEIFLGLPTELLIEILSNLSGRDLQSVRLMNHRFRDLATSILFRTLAIKIDVPKGYRYCRVHGWYIGSEAPCDGFSISLPLKLSGLKRLARGNLGALIHADCPSFDNPVAEDTGPLVDFARRLLASGIQRTLFLHATELVMKHRCTTTLTQVHNAIFRTEEGLADEILPQLLNDLHNLKRIRVDFGLDWRADTAILLLEICRLCRDHPKVDIHVSLELHEYGRLRWIFGAMSGISSLLLQISGDYDPYSVQKYMKDVAAESPKLDLDFPIEDCSHVDDETGLMVYCFGVGACMEYDRIKRERMRGPSPSRPRLAFRQVRGNDWEEDSLDDRLAMAQYGL